jgi:hypothetical protein
MASDTSNTLLKNLERHLPEVQAESNALAVPTHSATPGEAESKEVQDDYEFSRKSYRDLVGKSNEAIEAMLNLALQSEHPRAFEVLSAMLKNTSDITDKLMDLQKKNKEVKATATGPVAPGTPGTNNFFIGSTADLQKHLIKKLQEKNVTDSDASNDPS